MDNHGNFKFSIVTPVFNGETVIGDLMHSIVSQDYLEWELIIQDGKSNDKTLEIINSFSDHRIKVLSEEDEGMYDALNKGISRTSGNFIIHLNCDEQLMEGALRKIVDEINSKPQYDVYCFGVLIIDKNREPRVFRSAYPQISLFIKLYNFDILTAGIVYRKDIFKKLVFDTEYKTVSDALFFIELLKYFEIFYSKKYISLFLIEGKNLSLENQAFSERNKIKSSVNLNKIKFVLLYFARKFYKYYFKCHIYFGSTDPITIFIKGQKNRKSLINLTHKLNWNDFD